MIFHSSTDDGNWKSVYPSPNHAIILWRTFLQNVNPLSKVIHAPSVHEELVKASRGIDSMKRSTVALLFAIHTTAVMSMTDAECRNTLNESRRAALARYLSATQHALVAAGFMRTINITVLQAFSIYLVSVFDFLVRIQRR
jgi:hypothetical protein